MRLGPIRKILDATLVLALVTLREAISTITPVVKMVVRLRPCRCGFLRVAAAAVLMAPLRLTDGMTEQLTDLAGNYSVFVSGTEEARHVGCWDQRA